MHHFFLLSLQLDAAVKEAPLSRSGKTTPPTSTVAGAPIDASNLWIELFCCFDRADNLCVQLTVYLGYFSHAWPVPVSPGIAVFPGPTSIFARRYEMDRHLRFCS